ncbi:MAG: phosphoenolpyruvate carboxykinase (ATP), partial [Bacteroidota bacterium]
MATPITLDAYGIHVDALVRNAAPARLYEEALRFDEGAAIMSTGALALRSGKKTGRSPSDKRVVAHLNSEGDVWWGDVNIKLDERVFLINHERAIDYLNTQDRLYVVDGFAGWDPDHRLKVRIVCSRPYHALFMHNMLIRPTAEQLESFGEPDFVVFNAG